jgi:parvulin-like peptidyl-prolyl isomerase
VPKQIVEKMLDELAAELAGGNRTLLERKARKAGMTMEELREQARERAATSMLLHERCYKVANVTPKEVYEYFSNHADDLGKPASVKLQVLYLKCKPEDQTIAKFAEKLAKQLEEADEKTFAEYVRKYSNGPNTETDGSVGWIPEDKMRKDFKEALGSFQDGKIAGPVKTDEGYYFIRVMAMKGPVTPDFNGVKEEIKKKLSQKEEEKAYKKYISFLKRDAVIRKLMPTVKK